jgi:hypothetical protein
MSAGHAVAVAFQGDGSGVEHLSWGQWELWEGMHRLGTWMPLSTVTPLPAGTTVDDMASKLRFMMSRYQSMRTRLRFDPDGPKQVVASEGEITLEVVDADDDPAKVAEAVARRYCEGGHDFTTDWPLRTAVVRHRGTLTHQVSVMSHLVTDDGGFAVIRADLAARDPRTGELANPVTGMQPMAQARWQRSPAGLRQCQAALRYWEKLLRTIPARRFAPSTDPRRPRYWQAGFRSPALHLAVRAIAARAQVEPAPVLLAVYAVALARVTGINPVATRVIVDNRFFPGLAEAVAPVAQTGLLVVDVAGTTFDGALARTRRRAMAGYKYAHHDARQLYDLVERVGRERGERIHIGCFFNDRRQAGRRPARRGWRAPGPGPGANRGAGAEAPDLAKGQDNRGAPATRAPTREQVRAALPDTTLRWEGQQDEPFEELFVHVNNIPNTIDITALFDTHCLSPGDLERFLRGMETVAVDAASDPVLPTGVPADGQRSR